MVEAARLMSLLYCHSDLTIPLHLMGYHWQTETSICKIEGKFLLH